VRQEFLRNRERLEPLLRPPRGLIAAPVERAMMQPAEGHGEFIAHPAAECGALGES